MTSLSRRMMRRQGLVRRRERPHRETANGYEVLHPTKGWQKVSRARIAAHQTIVPNEPVGPEEV